MRTIEFNNEDIKECKLALVNQNLTSLQSAFLMQYITNLEIVLNEIREIVKGYMPTNQSVCKAMDEIEKLIDRVEKSNK